MLISSTMCPIVFKPCQNLIKDCHSPALADRWDLLLGTLTQPCFRRLEGLGGYCLNAFFESIETFTEG